jgi:hypothetical protein
MKKFSMIKEDTTKIVEIGDRVQVPKGITDPYNKGGQWGDVVHITKSGDIVVEFGDGSIGVYSESVF